MNVTDSGLVGKTKFPQIIRSLRLLTEELLRGILQLDDIHSMDNLYAPLNQLCQRSNIAMLGKEIFLYTWRPLRILQGVSTMPDIEATTWDQIDGESSLMMMRVCLLTPAWDYWIAALNWSRSSIRVLSSLILLSPRTLLQFIHVCGCRSSSATCTVFKPLWY